MVLRIYTLPVSLQKIYCYSSKAKVMTMGVQTYLVLSLVHCITDVCLIYIRKFETYCAFVFLLNTTCKLTLFLHIYFHVFTYLGTRF